MCKIFQVLCLYSLRNVCITWRTSYVGEQKLSTTVLEVYSQTHRHTASQTSQQKAVALRAPTPALRSHYKIDLLNWLGPRIWHINQRNAAPESCHPVCGQWLCRLKGKQGGDILISDSLSCNRIVQKWMYDWLCMNTSLVVNPQTRWTFPKILARQWQRETCKSQNQENNGSLPLGYQA